MTDPVKPAPPKNKKVKQGDPPPKKKGDTPLRDLARTAFDRAVLRFRRP